ncbi:unnamed protein product [Alopecurus aequalis]
MVAVIVRCYGAREELKKAKKDFQKTEQLLKAFQSPGQFVVEVLRQVDDERFCVKDGRGHEYLVSCRSEMNRENLAKGTRVCFDRASVTIMRVLPPEVDPLVFNMIHKDPGNVSFSAVGGLSDQIRELREAIELPITNPEIFVRVGIKPPKGVLLYGPPGTGKTLLARALASNIDVKFMKIVSSAIVDKYVGEGARIIKKMFAYAREHQMGLMNLERYTSTAGIRSSVPKVTVIMATNRPDVLDPALLRPGRLDRKIKIPLPNEQARLEILKIHAAGMAKHGEIDYEAAAKLAVGFNAADMRNVCTEAGMAAMRENRDYAVDEDFMKGVRKVADAKKLESSTDYRVDFGKD